MLSNKWPRIKISELCEHIVDCVNKTAPSVGYETPYKMIRTPNIKNGVINLDGCRYVEKETYEKWTRRARVEEGDILLTREAPMGEVGLVNFKDTVFLGQRIMQYRVNPLKLDSNFLLYSFLSPDLQFQFRRHDSSGSIISHIRVPDCSEFEINTPPLEIQKEISMVLRNIDDKIYLNNCINAELESMAKTLYDYWFVQFDFPNANGKPYKTAGGKMVYNTILKREIPEGWEVKKLSSLLTIGSGFPFESTLYVEAGNYKVITIKNVQDDGLHTDKTDFIEHLPKGLQDYCELKIKDVLISLTGNVGRVCLVNEEKLLLNQRVGKFLCDNSWQTYFYLYFLRAETRLRLENIATGSSQKNLSPIDAVNYSHAFPPNDVRFKFNDLTESIINLIVKNSSENRKLSELRDWLLPMLMNGQVTVNN